MKIIYDPLKKFQKIKIVDLESILGLIPGFVYNEAYLHLPTKDALELQYGFGELWNDTQTTIDKNGVRSFPGDSDLYPLVKMFRGDDIVYQYDYGLVSISYRDGSQFHTRMN